MYTLMYSFSYLEPVCCSMFSSNCCFLTCIQVSQEAGQVVWYSHLFQNFAQFIVIHTVKGFGIVNKAGIDVFLELSCFFHDPADVGNLISGSSAFPKASLYIWNFTVHILLKPGLENFEHYFTSATQPTSKKCYVIPRLLPGLNEIQWDNTFNTHQILNTLLSTDCMLQKCHIP